MVSGPLFGKSEQPPLATSRAKSVNLTKMLRIRIVLVQLLLRLHSSTTAELLGTLGSAILWHYKWESTAGLRSHTIFRPNWKTALPIRYTDCCRAIFNEIIMLQMLADTRPAGRVSNAAHRGRLKKRRAGAVGPRQLAHNSGVEDSLPLPCLRS